MSWTWGALSCLSAWIGALALAPQDNSSATSTKERPAPSALAELIDQSLQAQWPEQKVRPADPADDSTWLRRLSLDLCGTIPLREEVAAFLDDSRADKRLRKIDEYLADPAWAQNFSYLWSNALLSGAQKGGGPEGTRLRSWIEGQLAQNRPFDDVVHELISAAGRNDENGATSFVLAYADDIESLSSIASRTFLGVQIQCAQCHDHPTDHWKQDDFNGFTSFFLGVRGQKVGEMPPTFRLVDAPPGELKSSQLRKLRDILREAAKNGDAFAVDLSRRYRRRDLGDLTDEELMSFLATLPGKQREKLEKEIERQKKYADPRFLDGSPLNEQADRTRRELLADWMVAPTNPWFAKETVNRLWGHFFGKGLTHPVDDLTGSGDQVLPPLLELLAQKFAQSGFDLRYLMTAMARTRTYALSNSMEEQAERREAQERWFAAHPLRPFTAEQVLHSLQRATALELDTVARAKDNEFEAERRRVLEKFRYVFDDDEGGSEDRFASSIPQALFLMNGKLTNDETRLKNSRMLDDILDESRSDRERLRQIFLATVGRLPSQREAEKLGRLVKGADGGNRRGIEDLFWALLNSTEFLTNH
ncbi:MAG: DUF1549 domain-containing protein [Planctomycetes bacterium]|nr:DUF1549 domain-containing protein [Planctomycetota bacterium]